jgi:hypothetical protein
MLAIERLLTAASAADHRGPKTQPNRVLAPGKVARAVSQFGTGVFETPGRQATYGGLAKEGVEFAGPPVERFRGIEAIGRDDSGNPRNTTQHTGITRASFGRRSRRAEWLHLSWRSF